MDSFNSQMSTVLKQGWANYVRAVAALRESGRAPGG